MMKVCHIHSRYWPYKGGSAARIQAILENMDGVDNTVVIPMGDGATEHEEMHNGVRIVRIPAGKGWYLRSRVIAEVRRADIVHAHNTRYFTALLPFMRGKRRVLELHSIRDFKGWKDVLSRQTLRCADLVVVLSEMAAVSVRVGHGANVPILALENGLNEEDIDCARGLLEQNGAVEDRDIDIGYTGSFHSWQGVDRLVDLIEILLERRPQTTARLIGDGPLYSDIEQRISNSGLLRSQVSLSRFLPREEALGEMQRMKLYGMLRPKTRETELTIPLKVWEAASRGVVQVVTPRPGLTAPFDGEYADAQILADLTALDETAFKLCNLLDHHADDWVHRSTMALAAVTQHALAWKSVSRLLTEKYKALG